MDDFGRTGRGARQGPCGRTGFSRRRARVQGRGGGHLSPVWGGRERGKLIEVGGGRWGRSPVGHGAPAAAVRRPGKPGKGRQLGREGGKP